MLLYYECYECKILNEQQYSSYASNWTAKWYAFVSKKGNSMISFYWDPLADIIPYVYHNGICKAHC